jgi:Tol biopolymer transport system component
MKATSLVLILAGLSLGLGALGARSSIAGSGAGGPDTTHPGAMVLVTGTDTLSARRMRTVDVFPWDVSPDGRYVTIIDWQSGGNLAMIDLVSGELQRLTEGARLESDGGWAGAGRFSPDGSRIAYPWVQFDCGRGGSKLYTTEIRVIERRAGAEPVTVVPCRDDIPTYSPWDWTPDGAGLLVDFRLDDGSRRMTTVNVADGSIREIATFPADRRVIQPRYAPDGRHVVFADWRGEGEQDLYAVPTDGGPEFALVRRPGTDIFFGFEPGGDLISYNIDGLKTGLYRTPLRDGHPAGDPEVVRRDLWRAVPIGQTRAGFAYVVTVEQVQVQTASIDIERGRVLVPFAPIEDPSIGTSMGGAWSPDGRYLAYVRTPSGEAKRLVVRSVDGSETREYPFGLASGGESITWTPDGAKLIVGGQTDGIFEIDLQTGDATPLLVEPDADFGSDWRPHSWSPDGSKVILANVGPDRNQIRVHDVASGESRVVAHADFVSATAISPDGNTLAFSRETDGTINAVPMAGGEATQRFRDPDLWGRSLQWTTDGRFLVWVSQGAVWRMSAQGGEPVRIAELPVLFAGYPNLRLQPGGTGVSYTGGQWRGEVWLLEDVEGR